MIPTLPSLVRAEVRRRTEQQGIPENVREFCVWHEPACPAPAGGICKCSRVAITFMTERETAV